MKHVTRDDFTSDEGLQQEAARLLRDDDGLVCFPCAGNYRFGASLLSQRGVLKLLQTKRRSKRKPALVMIADPAMLEQVVRDVPTGARRLIKELWPGDLTLKLPLSKELPRKVYKDLSRDGGMVGVRLPRGQVVDRLVRAAGVPLLVSSANKSTKTGAASVASIRKQFSRDIALFIDAGDLPARPPSTVVELTAAGQPRVIRAGALDEQQLLQIWDAGEPR